MSETGSGRGSWVSVWFCKQTWRMRDIDWFRITYNKCRCQLLLLMLLVFVVVAVVVVVIVIASSCTKEFNWCLEVGGSMNESVRIRTLAPNSASHRLPFSLSLNFLNSLTLAFVALQLFAWFWFCSVHCSLDCCVNVVLIKQQAKHLSCYCGCWLLLNVSCTLPDTHTHTQHSQWVY